MEVVVPSPTDFLTAGEISLRIHANYFPGASQEGLTQQSKKECAVALFELLCPKDDETYHPNDLLAVSDELEAHLIQKEKK